MSSHLTGVVGSLVVDELDGPEGVLVEDLDDGLGAVVELEAEAAVNDEARVEAPQLDLEAAGGAAGLALTEGGEFEVLKKIGMNLTLGLILQVETMFYK